MLTGELYEDLPYSFEDEKDQTKNHIQLRQRRPSVDFNLAYEITQDTLAELFGDEQFPTIHVADLDNDKEADKALADLVEVLALPDVAAAAYEEGVIGAVGIVVQRSDDGSPFFDILPAKWCRPIYRSPISNELVGLEVTYPIKREKALEIEPSIAEDPQESAEETFWYRYLVGPYNITEYRPMGDARFARLGEVDSGTNERIAFKVVGDEGSMQT